MRPTEERPGHARMSHPRDELLTAAVVPLFPDAPSSCMVVPFPVGANGIAFHRGELVVASSERSLLLKVPVRQDLSLGDLEVFADLSGNPAFIGRWAPDGFDVDRRGNVFTALVNAASVIKVSPDGLQIDVVGTMDDGLTGPASVAVQERCSRGSDAPRTCG